MKTATIIRAKEIRTGITQDFDAKTFFSTKAGIFKPRPIYLVLNKDKNGLIDEKNEAL